MEKSKPSEEEIIQLGKTIVEELKLEPSVNTLGRWMSHYVAELIFQIENSNSDKERDAKQKECCELILKLWNDKKHLPDSVRPLSSFEPLIELLEVFQEDNSNFPYFSQDNLTPDNPTWKNFTSILRRNAINIFELCLYTSVSSNLLVSKKKWTDKHKSMLAEEEINMLEHLEQLVNKSKSSIRIVSKDTETVDFEKLNPNERYEAIFNKIGGELDEIQKSFENLKEKVLANI